MRFEICDSARGQRFSAGGEESRNLRFRTREVKDAVRFKMIEVILERLLG